MTDADALELLRAAVPAADGEVWADLGAGTGVFSRALAMLVGRAGRVIAVDHDARALASLRGRRHPPRVPAAAVEVLVGDVAGPLALPVLDGVVMANVLHFVADAAGVLRNVARLLRPGGRLVLMEYEGRRPGPWTPYPVDFDRFVELAPAAGFTLPTQTARRPSRFGGEIYVAVAERAEERKPRP
jgi:ubiquinone/menaquinone biosynthesis C-methylase UbiE